LILDLFRISFRVGVCYWSFYLELNSNHLLHLDAGVNTQEGNEVFQGYRSEDIDRAVKLFRRWLNSVNQRIGKISGNTFQSRYAELEQGNGPDAFKILFDLCNNLVNSGLI